MISLVIFYFLSAITLLYYPIPTLQTICYSLMIVYIYNKCNIKNYKSVSCIFLTLLLILFYLLNPRLIIAGVILLLLVVIYIISIFNNNILSMWDNNYIINMLWKGNTFIINSLSYIYTPIYKYVDIVINRIINFLTSPKQVKNDCRNKDYNELEKLESIFKNINEQTTNLGKVGYYNTNTNTNKHKFKNSRNNIDKQTKELINMFEQLSNIIKEQT